MEEDSNSEDSLQGSHSRNEEERSYNTSSPVGDFIEDRSIRLKSAENEDRISALHDSLIHHILSFLPLAEDVIKTSVLSKRWQYVWTHTPNLTFGLGDIFKSVKRFADFVDKTLIQYASSKIKKFAIDIDHNGRWFRDLHAQIESWIRFATSHQVEKLALEFFEYDDWDYYILPQFLYENHCLTELKTSRCDFAPNGKVDWRSLKVLCIYCANLTDEVVENILSGSPMLESLELDWCTSIHRIDISSKCLKKLVINGVGDINDRDDEDESKLEISGPYLENLEILGGWGRRRCKLKNLSSLVSATLDFYLEVDKERGNNFYKYVKYQNLVKQLLKKLHHVKELKIGNWCIQVLSILEVKGLPSPLSNRKCLILNIYDFEKWHLPGIASLLCSSPELEILIMECRDTTLQFNFDGRFAKSYDFGDNYWASSKEIFHCLLVHLKKVEIFDFDASSNEYQFVLDFVEFLLKNARVLEKMVIFDASHEHDRSRRDNMLQVTEKLLSFPRSSPHAVVLLSK